VNVPVLGTAEVALRAKAQLGEGPRWDAAARRLLWVDIHGRELHVAELPESARSLALGAQVCAVAPWSERTVLVALADRLAAVDLDVGTARTLVQIPHRRPGMRCNDGICDAAGRFWIGTMAEDEEPGAGALYRYDPGGELHVVLESVSLSNGIGWSPDGATMYYVDSPTQRVDAFDFDARAGTLSGRRELAAIADRDGIPDGLAVDDGGGIWLALYGGAQVRRYAPDGTLEGRIDVPATKVTACAFAGTTLYITSASADGDALGGSLFAFEAGVSGPAATAFAG